MLVVFDDNITDIKLNVNDHVELTTMASNGENILTTNFTFEQFEAIIDEYRRKIDEPTIEDLENQIDKLENHIEELQNVIEVYEEKDQFEEEVFGEL